VESSGQKVGADSPISGTKHVVGTQLGVLSVFERQKGWQDSVDRIMGYVCHPSREILLTWCRHPASVEAIVALTPDIVATGSEDGMIRVMQVHPNKFRKLLRFLLSSVTHSTQLVSLQRTATSLLSVCVLTGISDG
jgi:hypothetical protein